MNKILVLLSLYLFSLAAPAQENLTLSEALERAMQNNYGLIISRADTEVASINNNWGNAGRIPTIGFDASLNASYDIPDETFSNRFSAGVGLNWVLFDGFSVRWTKTRLEQLEDLSEGQLGVMLETTIENVVLGYYNVLLQQEQLEVLETVMTLSEDRYRYEQERKKLGGSVTYDVLQAQNVYLTDKSNFMNQEVVVRNSIRNLNFLMGEDPVSTWEFTDPFEADTTQYLLADLLAKMKADNQTLRNQYTNLLLRETETSLSRSAWSPTLSLGAGIDLTETWGSADNRAFTQNGTFAPYGNLRLSYDIYSAGVRKRAVQIAGINEEMAQVRIEEMEHALTNELFNLFDFYEVRVALLHLADENLAAARLNLDISEEKYRSGVINSFNYRDIQLIFLNAAIGRLRAVYNLIDSRTKLTRMTGGFLGTAGKP